MASLAKNVALSVGLISTTVRVESAVNAVESLTTLCPGQVTEHSPAPIKRPQTCDTCGPITDDTKLLKGVKTAAGYALVTATEVAELKEANDGQFKGVIALVPHAAADVIGTTTQGDKLYQLVPEAGDGRYAILVQLVEAHPEVAFTAMFTIRTRAAMYVVRVRNGVLMLEERVAQERLKALPQVDGVANPALLAMAETLLPQMLTAFVATDYADGYTKALEALAATSTVVTLDTALATVTPLHRTDEDLMAALAALASVKKAS